MNDLVARLKLFLDYKSLGIIDFSIILGYKSPQKLYRLFNTVDASPSCQIITDIATKFHEINLNWLFTGRGSMLLTASDTSDYKEKYLTCLEEKDALYKQMSLFKRN